MCGESRLDLAKKLLKSSDEEFKLAKKILVDSTIKFIRCPTFTFGTFNINIIKELNTEQLKFLHDLIQTELETREG